MSRHPCDCIEARRSAIYVPKVFGAMHVPVYLCRLGGTVVYDLEPCRPCRAYGPDGQPVTRKACTLQRQTDSCLPADRLRKERMERERTRLACADLRTRSVRCRRHSADVVHRSSALLERASSACQKSARLHAHAFELLHHSAVALI